MKKILVYIIGLIFLLQTVSAAEVAVIARLHDSSEHRWCVQIPDGASARDALDATSLSLVWSGFGDMSFLESVNGIASDYTNNIAWAFWHQNAAGSAFEPAVVGFGGYIVNATGTVIGLSYSPYDPATFIYSTIPTISMMPATKGLLISAGSRPIQRKKSGNSDPHRLPQMTTVTIVIGSIHMDAGVLASELMT